MDEDLDEAAEEVKVIFKIHITTSLYYESYLMVTG